MTEKLVDGIWYAATDCITCGVRFFVPLSMYNRAKENSGFFSCPSGHSQGWPKGEAEIDRIRRERDLLKQKMARVEDEKREAERQVETARRETARLRRRVSHGVCPCCARTFVNLARHMKSKHPEIVPIKRVG